MKKISEKDIKNGYKWCDDCLRECQKVLAIYKSHGNKVCEKHKQDLEDRLSDDYLTLVDQITWSRNLK